MRELAGEAGPSIDFPQQLGQIHPRQERLHQPAQFGQLGDLMPLLAQVSIAQREAVVAPE